MISEGKQLSLFIEGRKQRLLTNIAIVKRQPHDVLVVRGVFVQGRESELSWLTREAGSRIGLMVVDEAGDELCVGNIELLTATIGQNVQGQYAFWHARFRIPSRRPTGNEHTPR